MLYNEATLYSTNNKFTCVERLVVRRGMEDGEGERGRE